jgi:hypothetical protein
MSFEALTFDDLVDLLRLRLRDADALNSAELHSFKTPMAHEAAASLIADSRTRRRFRS